MNMTYMTHSMNQNRKNSRTKNINQKKSSGIEFLNYKFLGLKIPERVGEKKWLNTPIFRVSILTGL